MTDPAATIHPSAPRPTGIAPPRWVEAVVLVAATLTAGGAAVAWLRPQLLVGGQGDISPATRVYADYLISRNIALAVVLLALLALRSYRMLTGALVLTAFVQLLDIAIDAATGRLLLLPGLVVLTAALFAAAAKLSPQPLWRAATWRTP